MKHEMTACTDGGVNYCDGFPVIVPMIYTDSSYLPPGSFGFWDDPEEDIYTLEDGEPIDEI